MGRVAMDISYYKSQEPIFGFWHIEEELGKGSFGSVYKIKREDYGETYYSALKVISYPNDAEDEYNLRAEGMDDLSITAYYNAMVEEMLGEFKILAKLKGNTNIVGYENHMVVDHVNDKGKDILIQMEYLEPLNKYVLDKDENGQVLHPMNEELFIKIGIDICKALEICSEYGIIHRDIKPENIFVSEHKDFKLGDFGVARTAGKTKQAMSMKGTLTYMAPEMTKSGIYDATVDIYALGMVLYRLSNGGRAPFLPPAPAQITHHDREEADVKRMRGDIFPKALYASNELMEIIWKATSYNPSDRYETPTLMKNALEKIVYDRKARVEAAQNGVADNGADSRLSSEETIAMSDLTGMMMSGTNIPVQLMGNSNDMEYTQRATASDVNGNTNTNANALSNQSAPEIIDRPVKNPVIFTCSISDNDDFVTLSYAEQINELIGGIKANNATDENKAGERAIDITADLTAMEAFEGDAICVSPSESENYGVDNYGESYDKYMYGYHPYSDAFAEYSIKNIDADVLRFSIYLTSKAKKEYDSVLKFNGAHHYFRVLCDGKVVFSLNDISKTMEPKQYEVNIAGTKFLRIEIAYSGVPAIGIANPVLGKYR